MVMVSIINYHASKYIHILIILHGNSLLDMLKEEVSHETRRLSNYVMRCLAAFLINT
jgi:hypothetical protein